MKVNMSKEDSTQKVQTFKTTVTVEKSSLRASVPAQGQKVLWKIDITDVDR